VSGCTTRAAAAQAILLKVAILAKTVALGFASPLSQSLDNAAHRNYNAPQQLAAELRCSLKKGDEER
jgi:hypothetical protein